MHSANLALRLGLEVAALFGVGLWAATWADGVPRILCIGVAVVVAATLWGVFNVPGDPSRSGRAPVPVRGWVRLLLELAILLGGALGWVAAGYSGAGIMMIAAIALHYACSLRRLRWLLSR